MVPSTQSGIRNRLTTCVGCEGIFTKGRPARHVCTFRATGFPFEGQRQAKPCGVAYHGGCIRAGPPFETRLAKNKGLTMPVLPFEPTFICELCQVRSIVGRELARDKSDIQLLGYERMRMIDCRNSWQHSTLAKYGVYLRFMDRFEKRHGTKVLRPTKLEKPPNTESIPLHWAQLAYSLRRNRAGERVKFGTVRQLRSAANMYYMVDALLARPTQAMKVKTRLNFYAHVLPPDSAMMSFAAKGMERRLGQTSKPSWAISYVHLKWMDDKLEAGWHMAHTRHERHDFTIAATANLLAYLGWLRGGEIFEASTDDLEVTRPTEGPTRGLPPNVGAIEFNLLPETKSDPCRVADIVVAYETLSGLCLGRWVERLATFEPAIPGRLFSSQRHPVWSSRIFREEFAWPLLELMRKAGEPTLAPFNDAPGRRIRDLIWSLHSWRRGGRSRVSRGARHNEPNPPGTRRATSAEIYEHARWEVIQQHKSEDMAAHYNQWELIDRLALTFHCT
jgi:hypothetical protein